MLLGILSDSHDHLTHLKRALDLLQVRQAEVLIHAGDFVAPFTLNTLFSAGLPAYGVLGNNDGEAAGLSRRWEAYNQQHGGAFSLSPTSLTLGGCRLLLSHEPLALECWQASPAPFDLIVYGHTHHAEWRPGPTAILNPGEVCGWLTDAPSCALYDTLTHQAEILPLS